MISFTIVSGQWIQKRIIKRSNCVFTVEGKLRPTVRVVRQWCASIVKPPEPVSIRSPARKTRNAADFHRCSQKGQSCISAPVSQRNRGYNADTDAKKTGGALRVYFLKQTRASLDSCASTGIHFWSPWVGGTPACVHLLPTNRDPIISRTLSWRFFILSET